jgi:phage terminase small subunit
MSKRTADLGVRQERFVEEYLVDLNAKQAAIRAGYSPKTAEAQGSRLLSNVKVHRVIAARMAERSKRTEVAADRTLLEIARLGFSDLRRLFHEDGRLKHPNEWDDDTAAAIASIEIVTRNLGDGEVEYIHRIKLWDKGKALEQLSKHLGLDRDQGPSEQVRDRPLSGLSEEELYQRLLEARARLSWAIKHEQGIRCPTRLLEGGKPTAREGSVKGAV